MTPCHHYSQNWMGVKYHVVSMSRIGEKLRTLRQQAGLTTRQLGEILEVDSTYIVRIENGQRRPSIEVVANMARYFKISSDRLIMDELELDE